LFAQAYNLANFLRQLILRLPDKTISVVPEEDQTGGKLNPAQIAIDSAI
jgi:hypothetical protein